MPETWDEQRRRIEEMAAFAGQSKDGDALRASLARALAAERERVLALIEERRQEHARLEGLTHGHGDVMGEGYAVIRGRECAEIAAAVRGLGGAE